MAPVLKLVLLVIGLDRAWSNPYAAGMAEEGTGTEDWDAVAKVISDRLADTRTTQMELASRAKVSLTTVRELQHNLNPRRRRPQTLAAVSDALGWPPGYLAEVLGGATPTTHVDEAADPVLNALDDLETEVKALRDRVGAIERRLAGGDDGPER